LLSTDPLKENQYQPLPGLIYKYTSRALLTLTRVCASHCQYCFRQHFDYPNLSLKTAEQNLLPWFQSNPQVHELILSGGDPLCLSDDKLQRWFTLFYRCQHLKRIRIHTRLPIFIPQRVTSQLCHILQTSPIPIVIVIHTNHPNELDDSTHQALSKLNAHCHSLLNQSVLLKGVNDHPHILAQLSERLFTQGVLPYYLHQLDPIDGSLDYHVEPSHAQTIIAELTKQVSGYLIPRWVQEIPGLKAKCPLSIDPHALQ